MGNIITCPHCVSTFDADDQDNIGEYETSESGDKFMSSVVCWHCEGYVDIEQPEPNE